MRRVRDYQDNAKACLELAAKMPPDQREQLIAMAKQWERLAKEREREVGDGEIAPDGSA